MPVRKYRDYFMGRGRVRDFLHELVMLVIIMMVYVPNLNMKRKTKRILVVVVK